MKQKRPKDPGDPTPRVYSYIRFSTPKQKLGDSLRRQMETAKKYADEHGFIFDEELRDEGLSGWSGSHLKKGKLGRFLEKVESGKVPRGSVLFVEEIDRLSREEMIDAIETIVIGLIKHGITIATPTATFDRESLNNHGIWLLIAKLQTAHDESQKKSERLGRVWAEKKERAREEKLIATSRVPQWLKVVNGRCVPIPEAVITVQLIFQLAPHLGRSRLVKKLNKEAPWSPPGRRHGATGNGWRISYVRKILSNRAVLGEYLPHTRRGGGKRVPEGDPIPDYYPRIIDPAVFHVIQRRTKENKKRHYGGRTGAALNLLSNLAKCAYCGGPMAFRDHGPSPKGGHYLVCDNAQRGFRCKHHSVRYSEVQEAVLNNCAKLRPEKVLPNADESLKQCESLRIRISGAEGEQIDNKAQIANLVDQISRTASPSIRDRYQERLAEIEERNVELAAQMEFDRWNLRRAEENRSSFRNWQRDLDSLKQAIAPKTAIDARLRLQSHLKEFIDKVEIFADGDVQRDDPNAPNQKEPMHTNESFADYMDAIMNEPDKELVRAFLDNYTKRRMSKEGRFYRVHFKTGKVVDLVPPDSLAMGEQLVDRSSDKWRSVSPRLGKLWFNFASEYRHDSSVHAARKAKR